MIIFTRELKDRNMVIKYFANLAIKMPAYVALI